MKYRRSQDQQNIFFVCPFNISILRFIKENGGIPATFDEAIKAAYEDMYSDTKMIREKRRMKRMMKKSAVPVAPMEQHK